MPSFQSPEPISGRPCSPYFIACAIARTACSNSGADCDETRGRRYVSSWCGLEQRRLEERHHLVEHARRRRSTRRSGPGSTAATADRRSSGSACRGRSADATSAARRPRRTGATPPAADAPGQLRPRVQQRQDVLQLIAESERAAGLIGAAARPDAAAQRLVQQPAVDDEIERVVGRVHLDRAEALVPHPLGLGERRFDRLEPAVVLHQRAALRVIAALPERERRRGATRPARARR